MNIVLNVIGYQIVWCLSVWGAAHGRWWLSVLALLPFALWQLSISRHARSDAILALTALIIGFVIDSALAASGWLRYASPVPSTMLAPAWILVIWVGFALTLNHSMMFLKSRPAMAIGFGAIGGPLAYWFAGSAWGAVSFAQPWWPALLALALAWGVLTPALLAFAHRLVLQENAARA